MFCLALIPIGALFVENYTKQNIFVMYLRLATF